MSAHPSITIQPGSIKHKVLEAIIDLEEAATSAAIRKRHPANEHLVSIAIDQLTAEGLVAITSEGNYELTAAAKKAIRGQSINGAIVAIANNRKAQADAPPAPKPPPVVLPAPVVKLRYAVGDTKVPAPQIPVEETRPEDCPKPPAPPEPPAAAPAFPAPVPAMVRAQPSKEPTMANTRECIACEKRKPTTDFYTGSAKCKRCYLDHQKAREAERKAGIPAQRAAKGAVSTRSSAAEAPSELVIPAAGEIRCRATGLAYEIVQGPSRVVASLEQLQAIRDWATAQLKARP